LRAQSRSAPGRREAPNPRAGEVECERTKVAGCASKRGNEANFIARDIKKRQNEPNFSMDRSNIMLFRRGRMQGNRMSPFM
jgi:hypothetical protein